MELSDSCNQIRVTTNAAPDVRIRVDTGRSSAGPVIRAGDDIMRRFGGKASTQFPPGQASFAHIPDSVEGTIAFDGALPPPFEVSVLRQPIKLEINKAEITDVADRQQARTFERWLASFDNPAMYEIAHCTYGFSPGVVRCKGDIAHVERVFGCMEFGIGPAWAGAPAHSDGTVLCPSVWGNDVGLEEDGRYVHPELVELCQKLGRSGYDDPPSC